MLTNAEKTDVRRFMGYPAIGSEGSGNMNWQYYREAGMVEYRLNNLSSPEEGVLRQYLGTLGGLEQSIPDASIGLDTATAGEWVRNPAEMRERTRLFDDWRRRLCAFLGLPPGPQLGSGSGVTLVV